MRYVVIGLLLVFLAACGSSAGSSAPDLISQAGGTSSGPSYVVDPGTVQSSCSNGATEADGTLPGGYDLYACVFPSEGDLTAFLSGGQYGGFDAIIETSPTSLIGIDDTNGLDTTPPSSVTGSIASKTSGTVVVTGNEN
jgi:hypothetical protein